MSKKSKETAVAIRREAGLTARRLEALENEAQRVLSEGQARSLSLVSSRDGLQALIRAGGVTIQIEGDTFAVDIAGREAPEA